LGNKFCSIKLFFAILILCLQYSCETPAGHIGVSQDIKESKKRKVFIAEYTTMPNPYKINDTLQITVKEAWLEKKWAYPKNLDETIDLEDEYQVCINSEKKDITGIFSYDWMIGTYVEKTMRPSSFSSLMGDFKKLPGDTIEYTVQKGDNLSDNGDKIIIGKFVLIKKK